MVTATHPITSTAASNKVATADMAVITIMLEGSAALSSVGVVKETLAVGVVT